MAMQMWARHIFNYSAGWKKITRRFHVRKYFYPIQMPINCGELEISRAEGFLAARSNGSALWITSQKSNFVI
jgi:hypothetical protein